MFLCRWICFHQQKREEFNTDEKILKEAPWFFFISLVLYFTREKEWKDIERNSIHFLSLLCFISQGRRKPSGVWFWMRSDLLNDVPRFVSACFYVITFRMSLAQLAFTWVMKCQGHLSQNRDQGVFCLDVTLEVKKCIDALVRDQYYFKPFKDLNLTIMKKSQLAWALQSLQKSPRCFISNL